MSSDQQIRIELSELLDQHGKFFLTNPYLTQAEIESNAFTGGQAMNQSHQGPAPSLELIFETIHGFQRTGAVKAALELDVFTAIADGANTAQKNTRRR